MERIPTAKGRALNLGRRGLGFSRTLNPLALPVRGIPKVFAAGTKLVRDKPGFWRSVGAPAYLGTPHHEAALAHQLQGRHNTDLS